MALAPQIGQLARTPQGPTGPAAGSTPTTSVDQAERTNRWMAFLAKPETQAALMQFTINVMQPRAPGQSQLGAAASALGAGGEAAARVSAAETVEEERVRKGELATRRVTAQERQVDLQGKVIESRESEGALDRQARIDLEKDSQEANRLLASDRTNAGIELLTRRLAEERKLEEGTRDYNLMATIIRAKATMLASINRTKMPGDPVDEFSIGEVLTEFDKTKSMVDSEDGYPDGLYPDEKLIPALLAGNPAAQRLLERLTPKQRVRILETIANMPIEHAPSFDSEEEVSSESISQRETVPVTSEFEEGIRRTRTSTQTARTKRAEQRSTALQTQAETQANRAADLVLQMVQSGQTLQGAIEIYIRRAQLPGPNLGRRQVSREMLLEALKQRGVE